MKAEIIGDIYREMDPAALDRLIRAAQDRKRELARLKGRSLRRGAVVTFNDGIRPSYMAGLKATVVSVNRESITVRCPQEPAYGRFAGSNAVRVPLTLIA